MKGKKRILALLLTIAMLSAVLAGCAPADDKGAGSADPASAGEATTDDSGRKMEGNLYLEGVPLVKDPESFSVLIDDSNKSENIQDWPMIKLLKEQTNVTVDWQIYPYEVAVEKRNVFLNSGDYPDAMGGWLIGGPDVVKYGSKEGIFIPLEELFAKYAPKMEEVLALTNVRRDITLPDGHIYSPPYVIPEPQVGFGPWINQVWLDKLNLKMPTSTEELKQVLIAFRDNDPNGNGRKDEIPLTSRGDHFFNWPALFGYPVPDADLVMVDGVPTFTGTMDFYKEAINYFADLNKEKLLDPELFTQDMTAYNSKGKSEDAVYGTCVLYFPNDISPGLDENGLPIRNEDYVPLIPFKAPNGADPKWNSTSNGLTLFASQFVITDKAKNPATIVRWLDNLYELENSVQAAVGVFGVSGEKISDGVYGKLPKTDVTGAPGYIEFIGAMPRYVPADIFNNIKKDVATAAIDSRNPVMDEAWKNNKVEVRPKMWLSAEESAEISTIQTDIANYMKQCRAEWVTGVKDVNKEWDAYKAQLDKLGLPKLIEVQTAAINRSLGK